MNKTTVFKYTTWGLLALNIGILAFFFFTMPNHPPHHRNDGDFLSKVTDILTLDKQQEDKFYILAHEHKDMMAELNAKQSDLLSAYFSNLTDPNFEDKSDSELIPLQQLQKNKLKVTYEHLLDIKQLLNKDQLPYFNTFMNDFTDKVLTNKGNHPPHPPKN